MLGFGTMVLFTNIIVEMFKDVKICRKIPTKMLALIVAVVVNMLSLGLEGKIPTLPIVCETMLMSFICGYTAIFGFDTLKELYDRCMKKDLK